MTLDEWSESTEAHQRLKTNLQANIDNYLTGIVEIDDLEEFEEMKDSFLRVNLIMVRQFESEIKK